MPSIKRKYLYRMTYQGITLIEIMLILIILSIFVAITVRIYSHKSAAPAYDNAHQSILTIENAMKFYKLDNGFYPTTAQGIQALVFKPTTHPIPKHWTQYLKAIPVDQLGNPYHYENPGKNKEINIYSNEPS